MLDKGWSHKTITLALGIFNVAFVSAAYFAREIGCTWLILAAIAIFFTVIAALYYARQPRLFVARSSFKTKEHPSKVVSLTNDLILQEKN